MFPNLRFSTKNIFLLLLLILIVNILIYSSGNQLTRALINIDYFIIFFINNKKIARISFLILFIIDIICSFGRLYGFQDGITSFGLIYFLKYINILEIGLINILLVLIIIIIGFYSNYLIKKLSFNRCDLILIIPVLFSLVFFDVANGSFSIIPRNFSFTSHNYVTSVIYRELKTQFDNVNNQKESAPTMEGLTSKFDLGLLAPSGGKSIILIIVESLGLSSSEEVNLIFRKALIDNVLDRYSVHQYKIPFKGATTSGELRELCSVSASYRELGSFNNNDCLPNKLKKMGYETIGIHGFTKSMFVRDVWWPMLGIDNSYFLESMNSNAKKCDGFFSGLCDSDMISMGFETIKGFRKSFIYVLTLNSHPPLGRSYPCTQKNLSKFDCALHHHFDLIGNQIKKEVANISNDNLPYILIVGDHKPAMIGVDHKNDYSLKFVPGYILVPK